MRRRRSNQRVWREVWAEYGKHGRPGPTYGPGPEGPFHTATELAHELEYLPFPIESKRAHYLLETSAICIRHLLRVEELAREFVATMALPASRAVYPELWDLAAKVGPRPDAPATNYPEEP